MHIGQLKQCRHPPKVLFHDEMRVKSRGDVTNIPNNLVGSRPAGKIREEKMPIKGEEATTEKGL